MGVGSCDDNSIQIYPSSPLLFARLLLLQSTIYSFECYCCFLDPFL